MGIRSQILSGDNKLGFQVFRESYWEARLRGKKLITDKRNESAEKYLYLAFSAEDISGLSYYLAGDQGRGKTILMKALQNFAYDLRSYKFKFFDYEHERQMYLYNNSNILDQLNHPLMIIDDLAKDLVATDVKFKNSESIVELIIDHRYRLWQSKSYVTHFTSNWTLDTLGKYYQSRSINRLREMTIEKKYQGSKDYRLTVKENK